MTALARLSFWIPPDQEHRFAAAYEQKIMPFLTRHGLAESSEPGRKTVDGVFSRLFEMESPKMVDDTRRTLRRDPAWQKLLRDLDPAFVATGPDVRLIADPAFVATGPDVRLIANFDIYRARAGPGRAVDAGPGSRQGAWHSFEVADGLLSPAIRGMAHDRDGNLWIGMWQGGVSRYDGARFVTFTPEDGLAHDLVRSILADREGRLWFATGILGAGGVSRYDGEEFVTFTAEDGLAHTNVQSMLEDREGNLWFGAGSWWEISGNGISRYDGQRFANFSTEDGLAHNCVRTIVEDREGRLWFGTEKGVSRYDGERFANFSTEDGLAHNCVQTIVEDQEGNLWFGTEEGVSRYDGERFVNFTAEDGLVHSCILSIVEDREGDLWFGTEKGVSRYDGQRFVSFTLQDGLPGSRVECLQEDPQGDLWLGISGGITRYAGMQLATFTREDGLIDDGVMCALEDRQGDLWFGTWDGVSRYDGQRFVNFSTEDGLPRNRSVWSIAEDSRGDLWFGTWGGGVSRYDGQRFINFTTKDGLVADQVGSILEDREGFLWFGTQEGISRYDGERFVTFSTGDGLQDGIVWDILQDRQGDLWFATVSGVARYDGRQDVGERFIRFTAADGLPDDDVRSMLQDREGNIWFATKRGGLSRFDGEKFANFTPGDGQTNDILTCIFEDREGSIWFGTFGRGVGRFDGRVFQKLLRRDGLAQNTVQDILQDRGGDFWIATEGGVTRYRPRRNPPRVRITDVVTDRRHGPVDEIRLPASQQFLALKFQGSSLTTPLDGMVYAVRLEGCDPDWKPVYTGRVEYQNLPLGEYLFQVKAVDRDLNYSAPAAVRVVVEPDLRLEALNEALGGITQEFVGDSQALRRVEEQLVEVAPTDLTVLILGETGTGKGLAARTLHRLSARRQKPFIPVNCGAIPEGLVESELFGHEKGAFTGAVSRKLGKAELAAGGTLFLDEIGDLAPAAQTKLLHFLEERSFERVGGTETRRVDARVIAATNRDLRGMVDAGTFREDLYFRLQAFPIELPPLRARREDIPGLADYFLERMGAHLHKNVTHLTPEALSALQEYAWPGNVRELEHVVNRAVIVCQDSAIRAEEIVLESRPSTERPAEEIVTLEEFERQYIRKILEKTGWVVKGPHGAARLLGMPATTLQSRMKKLDIVRP